MINSFFVYVLKIKLSLPNILYFAVNKQISHLFCLVCKLQASTDCNNVATKVVAGALSVQEKFATESKSISLCTAIYKKKLKDKIKGNETLPLCFYQPFILRRKGGIFLSSSTETVPDMGAFTGFCAVNAEG